MAEFEPAVEALLHQEGGLSENPNDHGGITNHGISLRFLKTIYADAIEDDIRNLSLDDAKAIYKKDFWDLSDFHLIDSQQVANLGLDMHVNMGLNPAIKIMQRACNSVRSKDNFIIDDGIFGQHTIDAINHSGFCLITAIRSERAGYYRSIVANNPSQQVFLEGWLRRAYQS